MGAKDHACEVATALMALATHGDMECLLLDHPDSLAHAFNYSRQDALRLAYRLSTMGIEVRFSDEPIFSCRARHTAYFDADSYLQKPLEEVEKYAAFLKKLHMRGI